MGAPSRRQMLSLALCLLVVAGLLGYSLVGGSSEPRAARSVTASGVPALHGLQACPGDGRAGFSHHFLGLRFRGLPLTSVLRVCDRPVRGEPYPGRQNKLTYVYGRCELPTDQENPGCQPPLSIVNAPACEDNLALYSRYPDVDGKPLAHRRLRVRGAPAASFLGGRQLEVYTGATTVRIHARSPQLARAAARALRRSPAALKPRLNVGEVGAGLRPLHSALRRLPAAARRQATAASVGPMARLASPVRGALRGKLRC